MKLNSDAKKVTSVVLGAVCLGLLINLVQSSRTVRAGGARTPQPPPAAAKRHAPGTAPHPRSEPPSSDDPELRLDLLKEIQSRPEAKLVRNPFEFEPLRVDPRVAKEAQPPPPPPPPPPPLPIKALGYSEKAGGVREAYVTDDDQVYVVHDGESFGAHFKVMKISPQFIEIEDSTTHQRAELPFPQSQ